MKPNPFLPHQEQKKKTKEEQRDAHIEFLFAEVNEWFFNNDTTYFDPTYLESIEEWFDSHGFLTDSQYEGLQNIYLKFVCN